MSDCLTKELHYRNPKHLSFKKMHLIIPMIWQGHNILDIGFGCGELLFRVKDKFNELHGIDSSRETVDFVRRKLKKFNAFLVYGDIEEFVYRESEFDCITALDVLEHLSDPQKVINRAFYCLRVGGQFIVSVPNWYDIIYSRLLVRNSLHKSTHFPFTWISMLKKAGFRIEYWRTVDFPLIHSDLLARNLCLLGMCVIIFAVKE